MSLLPIEFPPDFDLDYYKSLNPEFLYLSDQLVQVHYEKVGKENGRSCCKFDRSENLRGILGELAAKGAEILEIGPWDNPFIPKDKSGGSVKYFDVMSAEELAKVAVEHGGNVPKRIDYVSPNGDLSIVDENFDIVVASHSIEHHPDLVGHLQDVEKILRPQGLYVLVVPDKRYCYDHFLPESTFADVIEAHIEKRQYHTLSAVIKKIGMHTHNNPLRHWLGDHGQLVINRDQIAQAASAYKSGKYEDCHAWQFTPDSFGIIINALNKLGYIGLSPYRLCQTLWGRIEFVAILRKENK